MPGTPQVSELVGAVAGTDDDVVQDVDGETAADRGVVAGDEMGFVEQVRSEEARSENGSPGSGNGSAGPEQTETAAG